MKRTATITEKLALKIRVRPIRSLLALCCAVALLLTLCACGSQTELPPPTPNPPISTKPERRK